MGGSSGGSSSGTIDYPEYMKEMHIGWLQTMNDNLWAEQLGNSPFAGAIAYPPDDALTSMWSAVCTFDTEVGAVNITSNFSTLISIATSLIDASFNTLSFINSTPASSSNIAASVAAWTAIYNDEVDNVTLPKYRAGMRDINAVHSSAFTLGEAYVNASRNRDIANYQADLRIKAFLLSDELNSKEAMYENDFNLKIETSRRDSIVTTASQLLKDFINLLEYRKAVTHYSIEAKRMAIAAKSDEWSHNVSYADMDSRWDFDIYQYGANMMAAISGGTVSPPVRQVSQTASSIGGALSGAASGAMIGTEVSPGYGTAIGAVVGAAAGLIMANN